MRVVSRPASGSVKPKQHWSVPATRPGIHSAFCAGVPWTTIGCGPNKLMCTDEAAAMPPPWLDTSCIMIAASATPRPDAAIFLRHGDAKPAAVGHGAVKSVWKHAVFVACEPIFVVEAAHHRADALANGVEMRSGDYGRRGCVASW